MSSYFQFDEIDSDDTFFAHPNINLNVPPVASSANKAFVQCSNNITVVSSRTPCLDVRQRPQGGESYPKYEELNGDSLGGVANVPQKNNPCKIVATEDGITEPKFRKTKVRVPRRKEAIVGDEQWIDGPNAIAVASGLSFCADKEKWIDGPKEFVPAAIPNLLFSELSGLSPSHHALAERASPTPKIHPNQCWKKYHTLAGTLQTNSKLLLASADQHASPIQQTASAQSSPRRSKVAPHNSKERVDLDPATNNRTAEWVKCVQEAAKFSRLLRSRRDLIKGRSQFPRYNNDQDSGAARGSILRSSAVADALDCELENGNYSPPPDYASCIADCHVAVVLDINENERSHHSTKHRLSDLRDCDSQDVNTFPANALRTCQSGRPETSSTVKHTFRQYNAVIRKGLDHIGTQPPNPVISHNVSDNSSAIQACAASAVTSRHSTIVRLSNPDGASNPNLVPETTTMLRGAEEFPEQAGVKDLATLKSIGPDRETCLTNLVTYDHSELVGSPSLANSCSSLGFLRSTLEFSSDQTTRDSAVVRSNVQIRSDICLNLTPSTARCARAYTQQDALPTKDNQLPTTRPCAPSKNTIQKSENKLAALFACVSPKTKMRGLAMRSPNLNRKDASKPKPPSLRETQLSENVCDDDVRSEASFQFGIAEITSRSYYRFDSVEPASIVELSYGEDVSSGESVPRGNLSANPREAKVKAVSISLLTKLRSKLRSIFNANFSKFGFCISIIVRPFLNFTISLVA